jgi:hypothetical protein
LPRVYETTRLRHSTQVPEAHGATSTSTNVSTHNVSKAISLAVLKFYGVTNIGGQDIARDQLEYLETIVAGFAVQYNTNYNTTSKYQAIVIMLV